MNAKVTQVINFGRVWAGCAVFTASFGRATPVD
jgi:hypothetical protein